eukprot:14471049-Ditylum_brightwellii.AAC.1
MIGDAESGSGGGNKVRRAHKKKLKDIATVATGEEINVVWALRWKQENIRHLYVSKEYARQRSAEEGCPSHLDQKAQNRVDPGARSELKSGVMHCSGALRTWPSWQSAINIDEGSGAGGG